MYQNYFGLKEQAFSIAVNPRYLYMSQQHKEALAHLMYGVQEGGFVMLTGEVGTGKTTIIRCLLEQMPKNTQLAIILNPMADIQELLCTMCDELGINYNPEDTSIKSITDLLQQHLLDNYTNGKKTVLLIDEAQLLSAEVLEQIRLLTNLETSSQKLLQIVLVGQPELNELLAQPRLRQLSQRITARFHLTPLTLDETERYIKHRLGVAGMSEDKNPFSPRIVKQIHRFTGGIPRMINVLCERTLIGAYGHNKHHVDNKIFELARREVEGSGNSNKKAPSFFQQPYAIYAIISASAVLGLALITLIMVLIMRPNAPSTPALPQANVELNKGVVERVETPIPTPVTTPEPIEEETKFDIDNKLIAQEVLFNYLEVNVSPGAHPCWQVNSLGHQCGEVKYSSWNEVLDLNRPTVLTLLNPNKLRSYVVLIGLQDRNALVVTREFEQIVVPLDILGPLWSGEVFYTWKKPDNYVEPIAIGARGDLVSDIAQQFALLDSQPQPLATRQFNRALQERIKIFQREHNLEADGILGERTLMKLNESLGISKTLNREFL